MAFEKNRMRRIKDCSTSVPVLQYLFCVFLITMNPLQASKLTVIHDTGNTFPIYAKENQAHLDQQQIETRLSQPIPSTYPINTPSLQVGVVPRRKLNLPWMAQPIFLIGTDERSKGWLRERHAQLVDLHATGMIIQANSESEIIEMRQIAKGLPLQVVSAESLVDQLQLTHYPVLISKFGLEQ